MKLMADGQLSSRNHTTHRSSWIMAIPSSVPMLVTNIDTEAYGNASACTCARARVIACVQKKTQIGGCHSRGTRART